MYYSKKYTTIKKITVCIIIVLLVVNSIQGQDKVQKKDVFGIVFMETMFSNVALNDASAAIKVYINELHKKFDLVCELKPIMFKNNADFLKSYSKENLAIINLSAIDYLQYKSVLPVVPMFVSAYKDTPYEEYLLLVKKSSKLNSISSFTNEKIGIVNREYNPMVYLWLKLLLNKNSISSEEKILSNLSDSKEDSQNIMAVFFDQMDACIVSKRSFKLMCELNPQVEVQLKILATSPGFVKSVSCYTTKFMQTQYRKKLYDAMLKVSTYPAGQQLLTLMKTETVIPFKDEYLNSVKELLSGYKLPEDK